MAISQSKKEYIYKWRAQNKDKVKEYNKITLDRRIQKAVDEVLKASSENTDEHIARLVWHLLYCLDKLEPGIVS